jgi:hypothetical protein
MGRYNKLVLILIITSTGAAITHFLLGKEKNRCLTCVCKDEQGKTNITKPKCNFESLTTQKSIEDLPADIKDECTKQCAAQNKKHHNHYVWSE